MSLAPPAGLSALASCNLKELHLKRADGSRMLDTLYQACRSSGQIPVSAPEHTTPTDRYLAVFDAALQSCMGCWILDYVQLVCADRHLTSNDPLEAYLLDGGFVKTWAQGCLQRAEAQVSAALQTDAAFRSFEEQLQRQLSQARVLVAVLRALDAIRAGAAGGQGAGAAAAAGQDRLSVKAELKQAVLLEQAFQVMDWCSRQGLAGAGPGRAVHGGRYGTYAEWCGVVAQRRTRAAPRPLFLDTLLESLSLSGAYPAASVQNMLHTLLLVVRDVQQPAWHAKLALLSYYLMDAGLMGTAKRTAGDGEAGAGGGGGVEGALEDLRRTFRLSASDVGTWQCQYLLDCAVRDPPDDPNLARACALLPACVSPATPFAFIEALLALGRPEVALAVDRGQAGAGGGTTGTTSSNGTGRPSRTLAQATTLLEIRLSCGLMTEAFLLLRQHTCDLAARGVPAAEQQEHTRCLLGRLADWAAERNSAAEPWLNRLTELPFNALEEGVLVGWLVAEAEAGRPAGDFLPLFFLQRGRVNEATAAWRRWEARQEALVAAGQPRSRVSELVAAALDAAHRGLPLPLRNVAVPGDAAAPLGESPAAAFQGAVGVLGGLVDHTNTEVPLAELPFHGSELPPLISRAVPLPPPSSGHQQGPSHRPPARRAPAAGEAPRADAASQYQQQGQQQQQPALAMLPLLPSFAPFAAPPGTPGVLDAFRGPLTGGMLGAGVGAGVGAGGVGGLLFSVGTGAVAAGGVGAFPAGDARNYKRSKPNDWLL